MKKLLSLFLLLPAFAFGQCPENILADQAAAKQFIPAAQLAGGVQIGQLQEEESQGKLYFVDSTKGFEYVINAAGGSVSSVAVVGSDEAIDALLVKLKAQYASCPGFLEFGQGFRAGKYKFVWKKAGSYMLPTRPGRKILLINPA